MKKFFDSVAEKRAKKISAILKQYVTGKTLDVGCGDGLVLYNLNKKGYGIDIVKSTGIKIKFKKYDGENIPFKNNSFDSVICSSVIHHTKNQDKLILEMKRVGKKIIVIEDKYESIWNKIGVQTLHVYMLFVLKMPFFINGFHSLEEWKSIFQKNGLKVKKVVEKDKTFPWPFLKHYLFVLKKY